MSNIIPQPGGAEAQARRTAAAALLSDYQRATQTANTADRAMWAARLADMLGYLLAAPVASAAAPAPLETEKQARELPAVRAVYEAFAADPGVGKMIPHSLRMLTSACEVSGVTLGAYDRRILEWLAGWEPQVCAVFAGIIARAGAGHLSPGQLATVLDALDVAAECKRDRVETCPDCDSRSGELCTTCEHRLARAGAYDALAGTLRGQW